MVEDPDGRAMRLASRLGIVQEARRLRGAAVGTEHVLVASLADPIVRRALKNVGVDLRDVQVLVTRASEGRPRAEGSAGSITAAAAAVIVRVDAETTGLDPDRRPEPTVLSTALGALMTVLLRDEQDTTARRILTELGLLEHADRIAATIRSSGDPRG